jgi:hypothetical protein
MYGREVCSGDIVNFCELVMVKMDGIGELDHGFVDG